MKKSFNIFIATTVIAILILACHQNQSATTIKAQKIAVVKAGKADTLIFKDPALSALVQQTYKFFSVYDTISPVERTYNVKRFNLSKVELDSLHSYSYNNSGNSVAADTMSGFDVTGALSYMIQANLVKILEWDNIDEYDLSLLFGQSLGITKSPDGRLYSFYFSAKTGGTYQSKLSLIHYIPGNGMPSKSFADDPVFNSDGYDSIDTIRTKQGIKYVMSGTVIGCLTCAGSYIDLVRVDKGKFVKDFNYNVTTRSSNDPNFDDDSAIIFYDSKLHHININYITNDMTPVCNCGKIGVIENNTNISYEDDGNENKDKVTCVYAFNGNTFMLKNKTTKQ